MARNIEHGVDNLDIVDVGIKHVGDNGLGFPRVIEDIDIGGNNGENRVISKSQPKDDGASLVDINVTYFEGVSANPNTSVDVSYNTLDSGESCNRDEITNEALWSDNEEVFEVRRKRAIMEKLTEEEAMKNNKNVTKESKKDNDNDRGEPIVFAEAAPRPIPPQSLSTPHLTGQPRIISSQSLPAHRDAKKSEIARREKLVPWRPCN
ncbi:hypothetical protein Ancab_019694 [Ancistrocladus abbreviatus]